MAPRALTASRSIKKTQYREFVGVQVKEMVVSPYNLSVPMRHQFSSRMIHVTSTMTIIRLLCHVMSASRVVAIVRFDIVKKSNLHRRPTKFLRILRNLARRWVVFVNGEGEESKLLCSLRAYFFFFSRALYQ